MLYALEQVLELLLQMKPYCLEVIDKFKMGNANQETLEYTMGGWTTVIHEHRLVYDNLITAFSDNNNAQETSSASASAAGSSAWRPALPPQTPGTHVIGLKKRVESMYWAKLAVEYEIGKAVLGVQSTSGPISTLQATYRDSVPAMEHLLSSTSQLDERE
jgi:hypothetical protein